jgi:hypothetical protein
MCFDVLYMLTWSASEKNVTQDCHFGLDKTA